MKFAYKGLVEILHLNTRKEGPSAGMMGSASEPSYED